VNSADGDTIDFSLAYPATITVNSPLTIDSSASKTLTINGPGAVVAGDQRRGRRFRVRRSTARRLGGVMTVTISGLTIKRGSSPLGGGVFNGGRLTLSHCTISGTARTTISAAGSSMPLADREEQQHSGQPRRRPG
jgi:hypothetical protein